MKVTRHLDAGPLQQPAPYAIIYRLEIHRAENSDLPAALTLQYNLDHLISFTS